VPERPHGALTVRLDNLANDGQAGEGDNYKADLEAFLLGSGNDIVDADEAPANAVEAQNFFDGGAGSETVHGGAGDDALYGDDDNDNPFAGDGDDSLTRGTGADNSFGQVGDDYNEQEDTADGADRSAAARAETRCGSASERRGRGSSSTTAPTPTAPAR
jgi:Ca2+-binding RTX toxin-like protein